MVVALDRSYKKTGVKTINLQSLDTDRYLLRSKYLPGTLEENFKKLINDHDVLNMMLLGHHGRDLPSP